MSRTYKHAPVEVLMLHFPRMTEAFHDHREGPCDLPSLPEYVKMLRSTNWRQRRHQRCTWDVDWVRAGAFYGTLGCRCSYCTLSWGDDHRHMNDREAIRDQWENS